MRKLIRDNVNRMTGYVPGEQPADLAVIKLNTNENPYPPSPAVAEVLRNAGLDALRRYPDPGCHPLIRELAALHQCRPEQIFVGNGSDEVLALCGRAFVENEGSVGYFDPSYSLYPVLADIQGAVKRPVALTSDFRWQMPADYAADLFFLTNPNAPTSLLHDKAQVRAFCRSFAGVALVDEAYVDFSTESCLDLALTLPNVLVARTLSKSYSLAGIRLGYAVGSVELIAALNKIKDSYNVSRLTQDIGLAAIRDQAWMRQNVAAVCATRERVTRALRGLGFLVFDSQTNFLWVRPPRLSAETLFAELRQRQIYTRYFPGSATGDYLRITIGTDAQMDVFLTEVEKLEPVSRSVAGR